MVYQLIFHTNVEADVSDAYNWYENREAGLGERFLSELILNYKKLENHPQLYGTGTGNYRRLIMNHFPYLIAYEIIKDNVMVYAVFHTSRYPRELIKRRTENQSK